MKEDEELFEDIMERHRASAPFPLRLVTEPALMDGHVQHKYSKVRLGSVKHVNASRREQPENILLSHAGVLLGIHKPQQYR